jgi:DNA-binding response OmpR family regulator
MKILVVDDNKGFLNVMGDLLKDYGYEVFLAEDGKQARELLEDQSVDLIISDVFMPTLDGSRFHSYVREFTDASNVPFIFISGFDDEHTRKVVVDSRIDFFVSKTAPVETIVNLIEKIRGDLELKAV